MEYFADFYDVAVIGAGHAGCEAALAASRLGCKTALFTLNLDWVANLPCNPSIGGTAKGHLVREIDALGGEMGRAADKNTIQSRMLNRGKGPAVHSLRAQIDRRAYSEHMKHVIELQENLFLKQAEITDLKQDTENGWSLKTALGAVFTAKCVIIATGTFLAGKIFIGDYSKQSGPDGMFPANELALSVKNLGLPIRRFKTGTPARVLRSSIDFSALEVQHGDSEVVPFSFDTETPPVNRADCYIAWTNEKTRQIILDNLNRSAMYGGKIEGVGPRYCPSIEDKIVRFADKQRHQIFVEPCGENTEEMYLQGASTSLPEDVQLKLYRSIKGLENVHIMRTAYAIEYDCVDPLALKATLEVKDKPGLFGAGQFNGSSGYEEAAAQGLVAGINAALKVKGRGEFVLLRSQSYIGTLIDDLVTKGCTDPYRMMTSRSEYRLVLRQDNAEERLLEKGYNIGLVSDERYERFKKMQQQKSDELKRAKNTVLPPSEKLNAILENAGGAPITTGARLCDLLKRPGITYDALISVDKTRPENFDKKILEQVETELKYEGYIKRQNSAIEEALRLEDKLIPEDIEYGEITGLRLEAVEKLTKLKPRSIGQASRISGVSPADISVLLIWFEKSRRS